MKTPKKRKLTKRQCARLGGLAVVKKYGREYMVTIGRKGGIAWLHKYYIGGGPNTYAARLTMRNPADWVPCPQLTRNIIPMPDGWPYGKK